MFSYPLITLSGYSGSGPDHWLSLWEASHPDIRKFIPDSWDSPDLANWIETLEMNVKGCPESPVIIAHSLSCLLVAHWAKHSQQKIAGAFLVAAPDPDGTQFPQQAASFKKVPNSPLPFPSLLIASSNDPYGTLDYQRQRADQWQAELVELGPVGHINDQSDLRDWPHGQALLKNFITSLKLPK